MPSSVIPTIQQLILQPFEAVPSPPPPSDPVAKAEANQQKFEQHARDIRAKIRLSAAYAHAHPPPADLSKILNTNASSSSSSSSSTEPAIYDPTHPNANANPSTFYTALRSLHDPAAPPPSLPKKHQNSRPGSRSSQTPLPTQGPFSGAPSHDHGITRVEAAQNGAKMTARAKGLSHTVNTSRQLARNLDDFESCIRPVLEQIRAVDDEMRMEVEEKTTAAVVKAARKEQNGTVIRPDLDPRRRKR